MTLTPAHIRLIQSSYACYEAVLRWEPCHAKTWMDFCERQFRGSYKIL